MVRREPDEPFLIRRDRFERQRRPHCPVHPHTLLPVSGIADPAPLGLAAFALTTFLLSARNAGWMSHSYRQRVAPLCSRVWRTRPAAGRHVGVPQQERRRRDRASAPTAASGSASACGSCSSRTRRSRPSSRAPWRQRSRRINHDLGWILLVFAIFNTYMLILVTQTNAAVFAIFLTPVDHRDHPVHRVLQRWRSTPSRSHNNDQDRRLPRRNHRARRLVHLGGGLARAASAASSSSPWGRPSSSEHPDRVGVWGPGHGGPVPSAFSPPVLRPRRPGHAR